MRFGALVLDISAPLGLYFINHIAELTVVRYSDSDRNVKIFCGFRIIEIYMLTIVDDDIFMPAKILIQISISISGIFCFMASPTPTQNMTLESSFSSHSFFVFLLLLFPHLRRIQAGLRRISRNCCEIALSFQAVIFIVGNVFHLEIDFFEKEFDFSRSAEIGGNI